MTANRRIFWNVIATYARSLFTLACGLLTGRWVLLSLGEVDYGLVGVVGCLATFIVFFNNFIAGGSVRFYAISIGKANVASDKAAALEESRRWFNTTLTIETILPIVVVSVGYPLGLWAIRNFLSIPAGRVGDCVWVFRCVCLSTFVGMVACPFNAMYGAKQYIAELTAYSFATTTLNVVFGGYMITHPGDWMLPFSIWTCLLSVLPNVIIACRALYLFPECRIVPAYMFDMVRLKTVASFSGCMIMGTLCDLLRTQGMTVVVNKFFGPRINASMGVATTVNSHSSTLGAALLGAFSPAITTAYGEGDLKRANVLALRASKFAVVLSLIFMLPLILEIDEVTTLWLKCPPPHTSALCVCMMAVYLVDTCTTGHMIAVNANGKIFWYNLGLSIVGIFTIPLAIVVAKFGGGVCAVVCVLLVMKALNSIGRVAFAKHYVGMSVGRWFYRVIIPIVVSMAVTLLFGYVPRLFLDSSFWRIVITAVTCEIVYLPLCWGVVLDREERAFVVEKVSGFVAKRFSKGGS